MGWVLDVVLRGVCGCCTPYKLVTVLSNVDRRCTALDKDVFVLQICVSFIQCFVSEAAALSDEACFYISTSCFSTALVRARSQGHGTCYRKFANLWASWIFVILCPKVHQSPFVSLRCVTMTDLLLFPLPRLEIVGHLKMCLFTILPLLTPGV